MQYYQCQLNRGRLLVANIVLMLPSSCAIARIWGCNAQCGACYLHSWIMKGSYPCARTRWKIVIIIIPKGADYLPKCIIMCKQFYYQCHKIGTWRTFPWRLTSLTVHFLCYSWCYLVKLLITLTLSSVQNEGWTGSSWQTLNMLFFKYMLICWIDIHYSTPLLQCSYSGRVQHLWMGREQGNERMANKDYCIDTTQEIIFSRCPKIYKPAIPLFLCRLKAEFYSAVGLVFCFYYSVLVKLRKIA